MSRSCNRLELFFFNATATPEIYTLSLHDALPICFADREGTVVENLTVELLNRLLGVRTILEFHERKPTRTSRLAIEDRKSTRLNSSHSQISYAVFCLKKKTTTIRIPISSSV